MPKHKSPCRDPEVVSLRLEGRTGSGLSPCASSKRALERIEGFSADLGGWNVGFFYWDQFADEAKKRLKTLEACIGSHSLLRHACEMPSRSCGLGLTGLKGGSQRLFPGK